MAALEKIKKFIGWDYNEIAEEEEVYAPREREWNAPATKPRSKVINIDTTARLNVVIVTPESFEDAQDVADNIKTKRPCVMNLESVDKSVARRIVDFLSGAVYAADGNIQKVSSGIFLVTPYNVNIMGDFKNELRTKSGLF